MNKHTELTRRSLIAAGGTALATLVIARSSSAQEVLSPTDPTAIALGYHEDHTAVDTAKWAKKAGSDGANQKCTTCSLYIAQDGGVGQCSIFPGKLVKGEGWCNAWVAG